jgi:AcrR family transcriptional regulator
MPRHYVLKRRAESMEETRGRIVRAAVDLHATVGPAHTTISAIADRAGVERLTVYRHFPDESRLFEACSSQWLAENPPPDMKAWIEIGNPEARLRRALGDVYAYYRRSERMLRNTLRDAALVPGLASATAGWEDYLKVAADVLARGRHARGPRRLLLALIRHTLDFNVWSSLMMRRVPEAVAVDVMVRWLDVATPAIPSRNSVL